MAAARLVICGSPARGRCAAAARRACELLRAAHPGDEVRCVSVADARIAGCTGCNRCARTGTCFMHDDMDRVLTMLDAACELFVVSPVFFAGPPAQLKALLDRLQPRFWGWLSAHKAGELPPKRPARLLVVGEGASPNGFEPLVATVRASLAVAGFAVAEVTSVTGGGEAEALAAVPEWLGLEAPVSGAGAVGVAAAGTPTALCGGDFASTSGARSHRACPPAGDGVQGSNGAAALPQGGTEGRRAVQEPLLEKEDQR